MSNVSSDCMELEEAGAWITGSVTQEKRGRPKQSPPGLEHASPRPVNRLKVDAPGRRGDVFDALLLKSQEVDTYERLHPLVEKLLSRLSKREARILSMRYGIDDGYPKTWKEIGKRFHMSPEETCDQARKALTKLYFIVTCRLQIAMNN